MPSLHWPKLNMEPEKFGSTWCWNRRFILEPIIVRFHVKLEGCKLPGCNHEHRSTDRWTIRICSANPSRGCRPGFQDGKDRRTSHPAAHDFLSRCAKKKTEDSQMMLKIRVISDTPRMSISEKYVDPIFPSSYQYIINPTTRICIWLVVKMLVPGLGGNTSFTLGPAS